MSDRKGDAEGFSGSADALDSETAGDAQQDQPRTRRRRRVTQPAPAGSDPHPFDPPEEVRSGRENDDRLKADKPPHWG